MTVSDIVEAYLREHGYDGLCNPDLECGCLLGDLMPCLSCDVNDCQPGYRGPDNPDGVGEGMYLARGATEAAGEGQWDAKAAQMPDVLAAGVRLRRAAKLLRKTTGYTEVEDSLERARIWAEDLEAVLNRMEHLLMKYEWRPRR